MEKKIKNRLDLVMEKLHDIKGDYPHKTSTASIPTGSLIIAPHTMSKEDFNKFVLKWVICMEKLVKKHELKNKKNGKN
jgi:hypothetical protein